MAGATSQRVLPAPALPTSTTLSAGRWHRLSDTGRGSNPGSGVTAFLLHRSGVPCPFRSLKAVREKWRWGRRRRWDPQVGGEAGRGAELTAGGQCTLGPQGWVLSSWHKRQGAHSLCNRPFGAGGSKQEFRASPGPEVCTSGSPGSSCAEKERLPSRAPRASQRFQGGPLGCPLVPGPWV